MKSQDLVHEIQQTAGIFGRNKDVSVIFEGDGAYTDGSEIVLPSLPQGLDFPKDVAMAFRGYLDHEAGHIRHTDIEAIKKYAEHNSDQAFRIWNSLEDMWLERKVMEEYPGSEKNFRELNAQVGKKELECMQKNKDVFESYTADAVTNTILRVGRKSPFNYGGDDNDTMYDMLPDKFKEWGAKWIEEVHKCKNSTEIFNLALQIEKLLEETTSKKPTPEKEEDSDGKGKGLEGKPKDFKFNPEGDPCEGKESRGEEKGEQLLKGDIKLKDAKGKVMISKPINEFAKEFIQHQLDLYMKAPEAAKLTKYRVLTTRFDEVYDRTKAANRSHRIHDFMQKANSSEYETIKLKLGGTVNTMKARLRRALLAKETRDWDFAREQGRLDSKKLVAGSLGSPTVYKQKKERLEMDTAVHLLIDLSGSMSGDKIQVAAQSAIAFAECLEGTQIKYQITGFSNSDNPRGLSSIYRKAEASGKVFHRTEPLNLFRYKKFSESLQVAKGALSVIKKSAGGNNSDYDAVNWATQELKVRPEKRKILFVFSDGQPANDMINSGNYGLLEKALKEGIDNATKNGVECVGIGILTDHVERLYPKSVSIQSVNDLSGATFNQLSNLLTGGRVNL